MKDPAGGAAGADWSAWLEALATAAQELEGRLDRDELAWFPDLTELPEQPSTAGPPPPPVLDSAQLLLERLQRLERRTEARRDHVRAQLTALAVPRPRGFAVPAYELGATLDVAG